MLDSLKVQKNVNAAIKDGLPKLESHIEALEDTRRACFQARQNLRNRPVEANKGAETPPAQKRLLSESPKTPDEVGRQQQTAKKKKRDGVLKTPQSEKQTQGDEVKAGIPTEPMEWTKVEAKKKKKDKKGASNAASLPQTNQGQTRGNQTRKPRLEAIALRPTEGISYAEILSGIREKVNPNEHETDIKAVRRTCNGDVLIEIKKSTPEGKEGLTNALKTAVGNKAVLRSLIPRASLEIRDLDSCATVEEVKEALTRALQDYQGPMDVRLTRPNKVEQRLAFITLNESAATALLNLGRVKVGWVNCRIRSRPVTERCFKCLGYGHFGASCGGPDRSTACYRCGQREHKAADCKAKPRCFLCADSGAAPEKCNHVAGSRACEVFKKALGNKGRQNG